MGERLILYKKKTGGEIVNKFIITVIVMSAIMSAGVLATCHPHLVCTDWTLCADGWQHRHCNNGCGIWNEHRSCCVPENVCGAWSECINSSQSRWCWNGCGANVSSYQNCTMPIVEEAVVTAPKMVPIVVGQAIIPKDTCVMNQVVSPWRQRFFVTCPNGTDKSTIVKWARDKYSMDVSVDKIVVTRAPKFQMVYLSRIL
jgi:hypothetical protein